MNTTTFIQKAKEVHGDKYDYSSVIYNKCDTKVIILCKTCNIIFEQIPYNHINKKAGCIKCYHNKKNENTLEDRTIDFIKKAKELHGDKYNYSKVNYTNSKTPVIIICNICNNEFTSQCSLTQHILRVHERKEKCNCQLCGKELLSVLGLEYHMRNVHKI